MNGARYRFDHRSLASLYLHAKRAVLEAGFEQEVAWQEAACWMPITEERFLSEASWVVLNSGMREAVVRRVFPAVARAFAHFESALAALESALDGGREAALRAFAHEGKIDAIVSIVEHVEDVGIEEVAHRVSTEGTEYLKTLPYIGPVTSFHLAKNLGQDVAKPDRHMVRIATACGYESPQVLCAELRDILDEPIPVIDIVLWRFATLADDYIEHVKRHLTELECFTMYCVDDVEALATVPSWKAPPPVRVAKAPATKSRERRTVQPASRRRT